MNQNSPLEQERLDDFVKILTFHLVSKIKYNFNSDVKAYFDAPKLWAAWHSGKIKYNPRIYEQIAKFNATALDSKIVAKIFGWSGTGKRLPYEEILKNCPDVETFNKCTVVVKNGRHNVCRRYRLKREILEGIFADEALLGNVLDAKSDFYTKRQRKLIFGSLLGAEREKTEEINEKSEIDEETKETMNEKIQIPEDDLPAADETGRLQAEIKELKLENRHLKSEIAALKERAHANRPIFSDGFDFEGQTKAMKDLLDECWEECRAEKESGKKQKPAPAPKPAPKPEPAAPAGADDIPATPPQKSKLYGRLQEFVFKHFISAAEAQRISEYAYRARQTYKEAHDGFCSAYAFRHADARAKIARAALAENPYLMGECDERVSKFVTRLCRMARSPRTSK